MKKIISAVLVSAILMVGVGNVFAFTPSATYDPNCIDIRNLEDARLIKFPEEKGKKVCGCKTCEVTVMTYDMLIPYINLQTRELSNSDDAIIRNIKSMIQEQTKQVITEDIILFTNSARAVISPFLPKTGKIIGIAVVGAESLAWIYFNYQSRKFEIKVIEGKNKIENTKTILEYMKSGIEAKNYLRGNAFLASMDNQYDAMDALGRFDRYEGVTYDNTTYGEDYFNKVKEQVDIALKKIENGYYSKHKAFKPDDKTLNDAKEIRKVGIAANIIAEAFEVATLTKVVDAEKIAEFLKSRVANLSKEDALEIGKTLKDDLLSGNWKNILKKSGPGVITFIMGKTINDEKKDEKNNKENTEKSQESSVSEKVEVKAKESNNLTNEKIQLDISNDSSSKAIKVA